MDDIFNLKAIKNKSNGQMHFSIPKKDMSDDLKKAFNNNDRISMKFLLKEWKIG